MKDDQLTYSRCHMFDLDYSTIDSLQHVYNNVTTIIPCRHGWTYNRSIYEHTVVTEVRKFRVSTKLWLC